MEDDDDCLAGPPLTLPHHTTPRLLRPTHTCVCVWLCVRTRARVGTGVGSSLLVAFTSECDPGWRETSECAAAQP